VEAQIDDEVIYFNFGTFPKVLEGWKGSVRDYRLAGNSRGICKPHLKQDRTKAYDDPSALGRSLESIGDNRPR